MDIRVMRFFLLDKITRWEVGVVAEGMKNVALMPNLSFSIAILPAQCHE